jgi:hypothetical protein
MKVNSDIINFFRDFGRADHLVEYVPKPIEAAGLIPGHTSLTLVWPSSVRTSLPCAALYRHRCAYP